MLRYKPICAMKKVFLTGLLLPVFFAFSLPSKVPTICNCDPVSNIVKTGQGTGSVTYTWDGQDEATGYEVWYVRGLYTSPVYSTSNTSFTFDGLVSGSYTFYFRALCGTAESGLIGANDVLQL